jgi:hypothetical protein
MNVALKMLQHDDAYKRGQAVLAKYNPCALRKEADGTYSCYESRTKKEKQAGCCEGCEHLGSDGCTVQAVACKLWLCHTVKGTSEGHDAATELFEIERDLREAWQPTGFNSSYYPWLRASREKLEAHFHDRP